MRFAGLDLWSVTSLALIASCQGSHLTTREHVHLEAEADLAMAAVMRRAYAVAPNGYIPAEVACPSDRPTIRTAASLSPNETSWLESRRNKTVEPMSQFLSRMNISGFDAAGYIDKNRNNASALPNVALAFSGGGYRALLNGAGALSAFDSRSPNSTNAGQLGGLLQASTYVAGLSGGSWLVGSIFINNFSSVSALQTDNTGSVWEFGNSIFEGPKKSGISIFNTASYFGDIRDVVEGKSKAGYNTTVTDYWGRALSYQLVNATEGGPNITWSSIATDPQFASGDIPMPLLVADARAPGEMLIPGNTTNYEFNPWEIGSFDPTLFAFAPMRYLGSNFSNGMLPRDSPCIAGYDNVGFLMGTSSTLFNQFLLQINATDIPQAFKNALGDILEKLSNADEDIANYNPNPFFGFNNKTNRNAQEEMVTLVDGGEDLQNIPLNPLIQPKRHVDTIFAIDSSADTDHNWPNGTSLVASYQRSLGTIKNGTSFPSIPDQNTFVNLGLNTRPTFFGCNSSNTTGPTPLIVYIPNFPYVYQSNVSTFDPEYNNTERDAIILNGHYAATLANGTRDSQWPTCVGCAMLSRSLERTGTDIPPACQQCFTRYCWNGTMDSSTPPEYDPTFADAQISVSGAVRDWLLPGVALWAVTALTSVALL
ncbi:MAG: Lysophospholipase 1 [Chaenotheca gracillima]|nr:MAG: Lysophospholipase 1 [Chaenotheca gracillima]